MSKELEMLKYMKRIDGNLSREQNQRYYEIEKALKRNEPMKPIRHEKQYMCPNSDSEVRKHYEYCPDCGQKLEWVIKMSKELEALKRLYEETKGNHDTSPFSNRSDFDILHQALTPPTEEEICKELSKIDFTNYGVEYGNAWQFNNKHKYFWTTCWLEGQENRIKLDEIDIDWLYLERPKILTMLGRFYEEVE